MITLTDDGKATVTGMGPITMPNMIERGEKRAAEPTSLPTGLDQIGRIMGVQDVTNMLTSQLTKQSLHTREAVVEPFGLLGDAILNSRLPEMVDHAKLVLKELKPEVGRERALAVLNPILEVLPSKLAPAVESAMKKMTEAGRILEAVLAPDEPKDQADAIRAELRNGEVRAALRALPTEERDRAVLRLADQGHVGAIAALSTDPLGGVVSPEIISRARALVLEKSGAGPLMAQFEDAKTTAQEVAGAADILVAGTYAGLGKLGLPASGLAKQPPRRFNSMTADAIGQVERRIGLRNDD